MSRTIQDSGILFPHIYAINVSTDSVKTLTIPSSRYYYLALDNQSQLPYLALAPVDQVGRDISAWREQILDDNSVNRYNTVYRRELVQASDDAVINIINIAEGRGLFIANDQHANTIYHNMLSYFDELRNITSENYRFELPVSRKMVKRMFIYPFNRAADFIRASRLASDPNINAIQQYLNEVGVVTFTAETLINLYTADIFFYLTRFYGPPVKGNIEAKALKRRYLGLATNGITKDLARLLSTNFENYSILRREFDLYFNALNDNPLLEIEQNFGAANRGILLRDFFDYLLLLRNRSAIPLNFNTLRQLNTNDRNVIKTFLSAYTDKDIISMTGANYYKAADFLTRRKFLQKAAKILSTERVFLMHPSEGSLCNNPENTYTGDPYSELEYYFLGKGSASTGFNCYDVLELVASFDTNVEPDGTYIFQDTAARDARFFTHDEIVALRDALRSGRHGVVMPADVLEKFDNYVRISAEQNNAELRYIRSLKAWAGDDPARKAVISNMWLYYFQMGMYMRQWRGPGTPYPIRRSATGSTVMGTGQTQEFVAVNVTNTKILFLENYDQLTPQLRDGFMSLPMYQRPIDEDPHTVGSTIGRYWNSVIELGNFCVRLASASWAYTGAHYYNLTTGNSPPSFNMVDGIEPTS